MSGVGDDFFAPQQQLTREQGIVAVMRLLGLMNGTVSEPAVRVAIYIPDVPTAQALELIYADERNRYYLSSISSGIIMLTFEDGTTVSLREALNQEKITVTDLVLNGLRVISVSQHDR